MSPSRVLTRIKHGDKVRRAVIIAEGQDPFGTGEGEAAEIDFM